MNGKKTALSLAIGSAFAVSLIAVPAANAAENPFGMSALKSGYLLAAADEAKPAAKPMEGKCGGMKDDKAKEGKCGGKKDAKAAEGKCGEKHGAKAADGKCGGDKKDTKAKAKTDKKADMKATDKKMPEGKCGEGKCGASKKKADDKAAAPAAPAAGDKK